MKKAIIIVLSSCLILAFTSFCTYAQSGKRLVNWYHHYFHQMGKLETTFENENARLEKTARKQNDLAEDSEEEILAFYQRTTEQSKMALENYQQAYLSHLAETKEDILGGSKYKAFSERKKEEISFEVSQDVEAYLAELLDENEAVE